jgi:hypothetical protein
MPPARDLRRWSQGIAYHAPLDDRPRTCPRTSPDAADAASSRDGDGPAGKPALPVSRAPGRRFSLRAPASRREVELIHCGLSPLSGDTSGSILVCRCFT